jgi:hypothetical protein
MKLEWDGNGKKLDNVQNKIRVKWDWNSIIIGCLDIEYEYVYSWLFRWQLIWDVSIIVGCLDID